LITQKLSGDITSHTEHNSESYTAVRVVHFTCRSVVAELIATVSCVLLNLFNIEKCFKLTEP